MLRFPLVKVRERAIAVATVVLLAGGVAWVVAGVLGANTAEKESKVVESELGRLYQPGGDRPSPEALKWKFALQTEDGAAIPVVDGVRLVQYGLDDAGAVVVTYRGDKRAVGWCFEVKYASDDAAEFSHQLC